MGKTLKEILSFSKLIAISLIITFILTQYVIVNAYIPSESMCDGINKGDRLLGFRLSYINSLPQRGDIVIFKFPDDETKYYIKRIIGEPGDIVQIKSGILYINDEVYEEDYLKEPMIGDYGPYHVPDDYYFMLGDNRNISKDSRKWNNTFVSKDKIIVKAIFKYYSSLEFVK